MFGRIGFLGLALALAAGCGGGSGAGDVDSGTTPRDTGTRDGGGLDGTVDRDGAADPDGAVDRDGATDPDGSTTDDGGTNDDGGGGGVSCGPVTCAVGMVCCNESCGICTPPDGSCIDLACVDAGGATDRDAGGSLSICGGFAGAVCRRGEWCDYPDGSCGGSDGAGVCRGTPESCPRIFDPVCGCDGRDYTNECVANMAGVDVASRWTCSGGGACDPMEARGVGACAAFFGYGWNGSTCTGISGCSCEGADCDALYSDLDECNRAFASCGTSDTTFECGSMRCVSFDEYCQVVIGGAAGARSYSCEMLPDRCSALSSPMCSTCFPSSGPGGGGVCTDGGPGEMTVQLFAP